ncbi:class IIb bacteriocin, lactobin A/cerein 7B family [Gemella cuniculi]|nr:class IIb bacteriocin, lactobin A/cerein 7B family [Gemella cuniculi]
MKELSKQELENISGGFLWMIPIAIGITDATIGFIKGAREANKDIKGL